MRERTAEELLAEYVRLHNVGVTTNDFRLLAAVLGESVEIVFFGALNLRIEGREKALLAFDKMPPSAGLAVTRILQTQGENSVHAAYASQSSPNAEAGSLRMTSRDGKIEKLEIEIFSDDANA